MEYAICLNENVTIEDLTINGFSKSEDLEGEIYEYLINIDFKSGLAQNILECINNGEANFITCDEDGDEILLDEELENEVYKSIGLEWENYHDEDGKVKKRIIENESLIDICCSWRLVLDYESKDKMVGLMTEKFYLPVAYQDANLICNHCENVIEELLKIKLISIARIVEEDEIC